MDSLDVDVALAFGADLTADPSSWVWTSMADPAGDGSEPTRIRSQDVRISRGRQDETSQSQPAEVTVLLDNLDGALSPGNPSSPWWPHLRRGTPMRVTVDTGRTVLDAPGWDEGATLAAGATTPDHASFAVAGDLDVRWDGIATFGEPGGGSRSLLELRGTGDQWLLWTWPQTIPGGPAQAKLRFYWYDGVDTQYAESTVSVAFGRQRRALRATIDVDDGAGGHVVTFYTARTIDGPWTPLGDPVVGAGTTSIETPGGFLEMLVHGYLDTDRHEVYAVEVRDGIDGTLIASPDFGAQPAGTTSFTDSAGRTWSIDPEDYGAAIVASPEVRFVGNVAAIAPEWPDGDNSTDTEPAEAQIAYTGAGVLRRLGRQDAPAESLLRRAIGNLDPVAYWPLEDPSTARSAASAIEGAAPATLTGGTFGSADVAPGSDTVVSANTTWLVLNGPVPVATAGAWSASYLYLPDGQATETVTLWVHTTGTARTFAITINAAAGLIGIDAFNAAGTLIDGSSWGVGADVFEGPTWLHFDAAQDGGNVDVGWQIENVGGSPGGAADTFAGCTCGRITRTVLSAVNAEGWGFGHLFTTAGPLSAVTDLPAGGFAGEAGTDRLVRLAAEAGVTLDLLEPATSEAMGPQPTAQLLAAMAEVADADLGILAERIDAIGLTYRSRASLYSQTPRLTLEAPTDLVPPLQPTHDDQRLVNEVALSQTNGPTVRAIDHASQEAEGIYDSAATVNVAEAHQLPDAAAWRLWLGTYDGYRFPTVTVEATLLTDAQRAALSALIQGDLIRLSDLPGQHPPGDVDLIVEGWAEAIGADTWLYEFACSPGEPWQVGIAEDLIWGRLDSRDSTLAAGIDADDTSLSVAVGGLLWSHADGDFDICIGGEDMTVTAIAGASSPQTFTVTRAVNGVAKAHAAGAEVHLAHPAVVAW